MFGWISFEIKNKSFVYGYYIFWKSTKMPSSSINKFLDLRCLLSYLVISCCHRFAGDIWRHPFLGNIFPSWSSKKESWWRITKHRSASLSLFPFLLTLHDISNKTTLKTTHTSVKFVLVCKRGTNVMHLNGTIISISTIDLTIHWTLLG